MANTLVLKESSVAGIIPLASDLLEAEPALNTADHKLYSKDASGVVFEIGVPMSHIGSGETAHSTATTAVNGFMSATDKTKLDGVATGANLYALPIATSSVLGGVKQGSGVTIDGAGVISVPVFDSGSITATLNSKADLHGSPSSDFAVKTLTVATSILPDVTGTLDIGSPTQRFSTIYVNEARLSTNTLYIGDTAILGTTAQTVNIHTDVNQSLDIQTTGSGTATVESVRGVNIATTGMNSAVQLNAYGSGSNVLIGAVNEIQMSAAGVVINAPVTVASQTVTGALTVGGDLVVNGTHTSINVVDLKVKDNLVIVNNGQVGSGVSAGMAGFRVDRGDLAAYDFIFDETDDFFKVGTSGSTEIVATRPWVATAFSATNHNHTVDSLSNVVIASKLAGDVFKWNGTAWANSQIAKSDVGLGNVDNTTDLLKPISTATQTALNLKATLSSLGSMSTQAASAVVITGGTINGITLNGGTF